MSVTYVSGNLGKINEFKRLNGLENKYYKYLNIDLVEIQGTAEEIAIAKCKEAYNNNIYGNGVLIEDSSLYFDTLNGLPGPYIKDFMKKLDLTSLAKLGNGITAQSKCIYAYLDAALVEPMLFTGITKGKIVYPRNVVDSFGWDSIFEIPFKDSYKTYSELSLEEKDSCSDRSKAFKKYNNFMD